MLVYDEQKIRLCDEDIDSSFTQQVTEATQLHATVLRTMREDVREIVKSLIQALRRGNKIIFFGNGGSAADAQHLAGEFLGKCVRDSPSLPALALHTNTSTLTAIANDYGYDEIFSRQLIGLASPGDIAVGISTSGDSVNVWRGLVQANMLGMISIGFLGKSGGIIKDVVDHSLIVPSQSTPRIQEVHILLGHTICIIIEDYFIEMAERKEKSLLSQKPSAASH